MLWINQTTERRVSPYGACPWYNAADKANWKLTQVGWTTYNSNNTYGICRPPFTTKEEAIEYCTKNKLFKHLKKTA